MSVVKYGFEFFVVFFKSFNFEFFVFMGGLSGVMILENMFDVVLFFFIFGFGLFLWREVGFGFWEDLIL